MSIDKKWSRISLGKYIKSDSRVAVFGFQFYDRDLKTAEQWEKFYGAGVGAFYDYIVEPFKFFGIKRGNIKWINPLKDTRDCARRKIKNSDILVLTDGSPSKMIEFIERMELASAIKNYKGVIIGFGAGAVIQLSDYQTEQCKSEDVGYFHGLGLVDNIGIEIHFEDTDFENPAIIKFTQEMQKPLYAIYDDGAVAVDNGTISCIGDVEIIV